MEPGFFSDLELVLWKPGYSERHNLHNKSMRSSQRCQEFHRITTAILDFLFLGSNRLRSTFIAFHFAMYGAFLNTWKTVFTCGRPCSESTLCIWYNRKMQCNAETPHSLSASKTVISWVLSGIWTTVHVVSERNPFLSNYYYGMSPKHFSRKQFCSYCGWKEQKSRGREMQDPKLVSALCSAPPLCAHGTPPRFRSASRAAAGSQGCAVIRIYFVHVTSLWIWNSGRLGQIHSLPMSSKTELHPVRPAASPLAPAVVNHASVEPDSSGEITL